MQTKRPTLSTRRLLPWAFVALLCFGQTVASQHFHLDRLADADCVVCSLSDHQGGMAEKAFRAGLAILKIAAPPPEVPAAVHAPAPRHCAARAPPGTARV